MRSMFFDPLLLISLKRLHVAENKRQVGSAAHIEHEIRSAATEYSLVPCSVRYSLHFMLRTKRRSRGDMTSSQVDVLWQQRDVNVVIRIHSVSEREVHGYASQ
jgi:hypothetical protein